jgi:hypothetical protein
LIRQGILEDRRLNFVVDPPGNLIAVPGMTLRATMKQPSAFLPLAMSLAALATVLMRIAMFGMAREADEGSAAHVWQLLMAAQVPIVAFFVTKWLPRSPRQAGYILALQAGAASAALAPVFLLNL